MRAMLLPMALLSLLSVGAIFGFFYAWVCSTLWGLDRLEPKTAIVAMQAMNASVRNAVFFPAFFLTPVFLAVTALVAFLQGRRFSTVYFAAGAALYFGGAFLVTALVNVPMNEALAQVTVPVDQQTAGLIWTDYSGRWQFWNTLRTLMSGGALFLTGLGIFCLGPKRNAAV
ncbi:MAG: DUF1772 domain-containing protein [Marinosulfonomonas sp.]